MSSGPARWSELSAVKRELVEQYIDLLLAEQLEFEIPEKSGRELVEREIVGGICYQLERVRCGKKNCRCAGGDLHGPYWYAYFRVGGRLKSKYVGKQFKQIKRQV